MNIRIVVDKNFDMMKEMAVLRRAAHRGLVLAAQRGVDILRVAATAAPPASPNGLKGAVNTGHFRQSWQAIPTQAGAQAFNSADYAANVEYGRYPGKGVPLAPLMLWAKRRLKSRVAAQAKMDYQQRFRNPVLSKFRPAPTGVIRRAAMLHNSKMLKALSMDAVLRGIAISVSRAIKKRGLKGRGTIATSWQKIEKAAYLEVARELRDVAMRKRP